MAGYALASAVMHPLSIAVRKKNLHKKITFRVTTASLGQYLQRYTFVLFLRAAYILVPYCTRKVLNLPFRGKLGTKIYATSQVKGKVYFKTFRPIITSLILKYITILKLMKSF